MYFRVIDMAIREFHGLNENHQDRYSRNINSFIILSPPLLFSLIHVDVDNEHITYKRYGEFGLPVYSFPPPPSPALSPSLGVAANFSTPAPDDEILSCVARAVKTKSQNKPRSRARTVCRQQAGLLRSPTFIGAATRRRKDVRITSKYLKISTRNAGDPLLIKTAGCGRINARARALSPRPGRIRESILAAREKESPEASRYSMPARDVSREYVRATLLCAALRGVYNTFPFYRGARK